MFIYISNLLISPSFSENLFYDITLDLVAGISYEAVCRVLRLLAFGIGEDPSSHSINGRYLAFFAESSGQPRAAGM